MHSPSYALRLRWLDALLPNVPFDGWTKAAAEKAAETAKLTDGEKALAAPHGLADLVDAFFDMAQDTAKSELIAADLSEFGVREKAAKGVRAWLAALEPNKEAARRAAVRGFLPWVAGDALQRTYSVADMIWTGIGDTSEDHNKYTKRGLLASALPLIFMRWLDEEDEDALNDYIFRRLTGAMKFGQTAGKVAAPLIDFANKLTRS